MHLCFATSTNRRFRRDGDYFVSEMQWYERIQGPNVICNKIPAKGRSHAQLRRILISQTTDCLSQHGASAITNVAFFVHGTSKWLLGGGLNIWNADTWTELFAPGQPLQIALYSCSNGSWINRSTPGYSAKKFRWNYNFSEGVMRGEYGFAMRLAWYLAKRRHPLQIYAHTTKGDTTRNPYAVWITWQPGSPTIKREWVVKPTKRNGNPEARERWLQWIRCLRYNANFRYRVPYMDRSELDQWLEVSR